MIYFNNLFKDMKWLTEQSREFLSRGYLLEGQSAEDRIRQIANRAEEILSKEGFADKFYRYMSEWYYSLSSPIWANFWLERWLPISCFTSYVGDDMWDILFSVWEMWMMSKYGWGTGWYFGDLRPRGAKIKDNWESSGAVHFMQLFDSGVNTVSQWAVRRGAFAAYLPIEHPDAAEFLEIRTEGNPIQNLNFWITVWDEWLKEMEEGDIEKRKLWARVIKSRTETGMPYIFFSDTVNNNTVDVYKDKGHTIYSSNLCVKWDTKILTSEWYKEIKDSVWKAIVWNWEKMSEVEVVKTWENKKLIKVSTSSWNAIECTPYHKFYIQNEYWKTPNKVEAKDLKIWDKLIRFELPTIEWYEELDYAYDNWFYTWDWTELSSWTQRIYFYWKKRNTAKFRINSSIYHNIYTQENQDREIYETNLLKDKYFIPNSDYTIKSRIEWLSWYADADWTITNNNWSQSLQIASINKQFLQDLQLMLQTLWVESKISKARDAGEYELPLNDWSGLNWLYPCKEVNRIIINWNSLYQLHKLWFNTSRLSCIPKEPQRKCSEFFKVVWLEEVEWLHDTYCFNEPIRHMGMFNWILTGNCSEIMLPTNTDWSFVCCLSSINIAEYDKWKNTDAVEVLTYFLDAVMEEFIQKGKQIEWEAGVFLKRAIKFAEDNRALGLWVLGYHSYLQSNWIPFESQEASNINKEIFSLIREKSYKASEELAKEFGEPEVLKWYGRRNTTLNAVAPTTSSAFILGQVSQSIEPFWSNCYVKDLAKTKVTIKNKELEKLLEELGKNTKEVWKSIKENDWSVQHLGFLNRKQKDIFKTFSEINQYSIIDQAADRQKFIDQSQSLNLLISPNTSAKDINSLYLDAWKQGIKTLYYQHSKSAAQELRRKISCAGCEA